MEDDRAEVITELGALRIEVDFNWEVDIIDKAIRMLKEDGEAFKTIAWNIAEYDKDNRQAHYALMGIDVAIAGLKAGD